MARAKTLKRSIKSNRRFHFSDITLPPQYKELGKIQKDAILLLQEGQKGTKPNPAAYELARKTISKLVIEDSKDSFDMS